MAEALLFLIWLVLWIALLYWVWTDAEENSTHSSVMWVVIVFFAGLIGLILYVIFGRDDTDPGV